MLQDLIYAIKEGFKTFRNCRARRIRRERASQSVPF